MLVRTQLFWGKLELPGGGPRCLLLLPAPGYGGRPQPPSEVRRCPTADPCSCPSRTAPAARDLRRLGLRQGQRLWPGRQVGEREGPSRWRGKRKAFQVTRSREGSPCFLYSFFKKPGASPRTPSARLGWQFRVPGWVHQPGHCDAPGTLPGVMCYTGARQNLGDPGSSKTHISALSGEIHTEQPVSDYRCYPVQRNCAGGGCLSAVRVRSLQGVPCAAKLWPSTRPRSRSGTAPTANRPD